MVSGAPQPARSRRIFLQIIRGLSVALLLLAPAMFLCGCSDNGGGGGGGGGDTAMLTVRVMADCTGLTGCTDVYVDGVKVGDAVPAGGQVSGEVTVGTHAIYASGGCELIRYWGPFDRNVPTAGWTENLSCAAEASVELTVEVEPACAGVERDIVVKMDEVTIATLQPGGEKTVHVSSGSHVLEARSAGGFVWGPVTRTITGATTETFGCNPAVPGPLTVAVSTGCPDLNYVQIYVDGEYIGQVECGGHAITENIPNGYKTVTAVGYRTAQVETFSAGPYEVYLPVTGASFLIPGADFRLGPAAGRRSRR